MTGTKLASFISNLVPLAERAARHAVYASGALMIGSISLIVYDVITRKLFGWSTGGSDEISGYVFAISTSWSLAFTTLHRVHVRVDLLYQHLPVRLSALLDWLALVALGVFMGWLTFYAYGVVAGSIEQNSHANTPLGTPLVLPQGLWFAGLVFMCLIMGLLLLRASVALVTGDIAAIKSLAGIRTAQEEADEEVAAGERLIEGERG